MKIERIAGHNEAREALVLSVAGVTAIMLITNLLLLIFYWDRLLKQRASSRQLGDVRGNALDVEKYPTQRHTKRKMNRSAQWAFFGPS
jgi:hypothetical protein